MSASIYRGGFEGFWQLAQGDLRIGVGKRQRFFWNCAFAQQRAIDDGSNEERWAVPTLQEGSAGEYHRGMGQCPGKMTQLIEIYNERVDEAGRGKPYLKIDASRL